jgi:hypothetical protein
MDTAKVIVVRKKDGPHVTSFSYVDPAAPDRQSQFRARDSREEFALTPAQAAAAIATGGFEVRPDSKSEAEDDARISAAADGPEVSDELADSTEENQDADTTRL